MNTLLSLYARALLFLIAPAIKLHNNRQAKIASEFFSLEGCAHYLRQKASPSK